MCSKRIEQCLLSAAARGALTAKLTLAIDHDGIVYIGAVTGLFPHRGSSSKLQSTFQLSAYFYWPIKRAIVFAHEEASHADETSCVGVPSFAAECLRPALTTCAAASSAFPSPAASKLAV